MHKACAKGVAEIVELLLSRGVNVNAMTKVSYVVSPRTSIVM